MLTISCLFKSIAASRGFACDITALLFEINTFAALLSGLSKKNLNCVDVCKPINTIVGFLNLFNNNSRIFLVVTEPD